MVDVEHAAALPFDINAPARARELAGRCVSDWPPERVDDVLLCVSELVTNAFVHGAPDLHVEVRPDSDAVLVAVTDRSDDLPATPSRSDAAEPRGRGLLLVSLLASAWGTRPADDGRGGKTVWCEIPGSSSDDTPADSRMAS